MYTFKTSVSSGFFGDFFNRISQYLASNSGDLDVLDPKQQDEMTFCFSYVLAILVTVFSLINARQALSSEATKPEFPLNDTLTRSLCFK